MLHYGSFMAGFWFSLVKIGRLLKYLRRDYYITVHDNSSWRIFGN